MRDLRRRAEAKLGLTGVMLLAFLAMDVTFKSVVFPAYLDLTVGADVVRRSAVADRLLVAGGIAVGLLLCLLAVLMRPVERWRRANLGSVGDDTIRRTSVAIRRLPRLAAVAWSFEWVACVGITTIRDGSASHASAFFLTAMALGPLPLAHGLAHDFLARELANVSLVARARGITIEAPTFRLWSRLALYCLCVAIAPTAYVAALVVSPIVQSMPLEVVLRAVGVFFAGVGIFACLTAVLLARSITTPVGEMARVMGALIAQADVSSVARLPVHDHDEVGALAELTNRMLDRLEATAEEREYAWSALATLNHRLEERVAERTAQLNAQAHQMRLVLDNVDQGLFTVDRSGSMPAEVSKTLTDWFGVAANGEPFFHYVGRTVPSFATAAEVAWSQVTDDLLPIEVSLDQMPKRARYEVGGAPRFLHFSYEPIEDDPAGRILIVVTDETARIEHENAELERRETLAMFDHFVAERRVFLEFMAEGRQILASVPPDGDFDGDHDVTVLNRAIHTLKGNASSFGLESVARLCHRIESALADELPVRPLLTELHERWARLDAKIERLGGRRLRTLEVSLDDHAALETAIRRGASRARLAQMVHELTLEPVSVRFNHLADQARQVAHRLGKTIFVEICDAGLRLDADRWSRLWSAMVHPIRNAVDHGIETSSERRRASKPEDGRLTLRSARDGSNVVIEIEDDGRGIPWPAIAASCASRGLPAETHEDLVEALFADGFSTASSVTDLSGRGVGMGALRSAVEALEGTLDVRSEPGRGTRLRMTFPHPTGAADARGTWVHLATG